MQRITRQQAAALCLVAFFGAVPAAAQSCLRLWGMQHYDTESVDLPCQQVRAYVYNTALQRVDGRWFIQGHNQSGQAEVPQGIEYADILLVGGYTIGVRRDGTVDSWGFHPWFTLPTLPPGTTCLHVAGGGKHLLLQRSDLWIDAVGLNLQGQCNVPTAIQGTVLLDLQASTDTSAALDAQGNLWMWGDNSFGQASPPPLPPGVWYRAISLSGRYTLALRSDGQIAAFGDNTYGQCNVPALPAGMTYVACSAGFAHAAALRSDGGIVCWGDASLGQLDVPVLPPGSVVREIAAGYGHTVARLANGGVVSWGLSAFFQRPLPRLPRRPAEVRYADGQAGWLHTLTLLSDGTIQAIGNNNVGQCDVPPLPPGLRYIKIEAANVNSGALRSDGQLLLWGNNNIGQLNIPPLPPGLTYVDFSMWGHTVALRSDGAVFAVGGQQTAGVTNIPPLPPGVTYTDVEAHYYSTILLRSDGQVVVTGTNWAGQQNVPSLPPGVSYVEVEASEVYLTGRRSDGSVVTWGGVGNGLAGNSWVPPPPVPFGVYCVEVAAAFYGTALRYSDGNVHVFGHIGQPTVRERLQNVPPLASGTSYVQISAENDHFLGRVGPQSTYVSFAAGCSGSQQASRLVPGDTPKIGREMLVRVFDLPVDVAVLAMGLQQAAPIDLSSVGMPGCTWHVSVDGTAVLVGQQGHAQWTLPIPDEPSLVGMRFYNQALVLDPSAGVFPAVVSNAAEGVIGYP